MNSKARREALIAHMKETREAINALMNEANDEIAKLEADKHDLMCAAETAELEIADLRDKIAKLEADKHDLMYAAENAELEIADLRDKIIDIEIYTDHAAAENADLKAANAILTEANDSLTATTDGVLSANADLKAANAALAAENADLKAAKATRKAESDPEPRSKNKCKRRRLAAKKLIKAEVDNTVVGQFLSHFYTETGSDDDKLRLKDMWETLRHDGRSYYDQMSITVTAQLSQKLKQHGITVKTGSGNRSYVYGFKVK